MTETKSESIPIPADNLERSLTSVRADEDRKLKHLGMVGDTYTVTISGDDTAGQFCAIDMHVPSGGGPGPHRHDFEEAFFVLEGELEVTFRGQKSSVGAGASINIPANAPHQFHNASSKPARLLCICSPAGQEKFFEELAVRVDSRTARPPELDEAQQAAFQKKAAELAPRYRTELLEQA